MNTLYGDATHGEILLRARIRQARLIVFSISDYRATEQGVRLARKLNPDLFIMVRTRSAAHVEKLTEAGATEVIPEEFETSIEIFSRVLREYRIANNVIEQQVELVRMEGYSMFRGLSLTMESLKKFSTYLTVSLTESFHVLEDSWCNGKNLREIELDSEQEVRLIAVVRGKEIHANPDIDFRFKEGDIIVLFGRHAGLDNTVKGLQFGFG